MVFLPLSNAYLWHQAQFISALPGLRDAILVLLASIEVAIKDSELCIDDAFRQKASRVFEDQELVTRVKNLILELTLMARGFPKQPKRQNLSSLIG